MTILVVATYMMDFIFAIEKASPTQQLPALQQKI